MGKWSLRVGVGERLWVGGGGGLGMAGLSWVWGNGASPDLQKGWKQGGWAGAALRVRSVTCIQGFLSGLRGLCRKGLLSSCCSPRPGLVTPLHGRWQVC